MSFSKRAAVLFAIWLSLVGLAPAQDRLQPFAMAWDDVEPTVVDLSFLSPTPAGADGPVRVGDDGHLHTGRQRLRLWGNNIGGGTVFADGVTDDQRAAFAGRMRKFGYNAIRFHHLEATWVGRNVFGPVRQNRNDSTRQIDAESMDRLYRWFSAFKRHGIYINMNLLVSRRFESGDGVPGIDAVDWKTQGMIAMWHPTLIQLQKDYARQLLAGDNPHTGLPIARDPSLATVEINNENGILQAWLGGQLDQVPPPLVEPLRRAWNDWLTAKYKDQATLAAAWNARDVPLGRPMIDGAAGFFLERHDDAAAAVETADGVSTIRVERPGSAGWHVQWGHGRLRLDAGEPYTLRFDARSDQPRRIAVGASQAHAPWEGLGFNASIELQPQWKTFEFVVLPTRGDDNARILFSNLSQASATFAIRNVSLRPGGRVGGETALGKVPLPSRAGGQAFTSAQRRDFIAFCVHAERAYFREMRRFVKEELGVTAPVVGTIVGCSPIGVQADMDAIDTHAYWRHPEFPGRAWDPNDWVVRRDAMVDHPTDSAILDTMLKQVRVDGRRLPHMLTEYDHPAPNPSAAEGPLFLAAYASLQDYDAVYLFAYDVEFAGPRGRIGGFFDTAAHPTVAANALAAALLFRRGDVPPAEHEAVVAVSREQELDALAEHGAAWSMVDYRHLGGDATAAFSRRVGVDLVAERPKPPTSQPAVATEPFVTERAELSWRTGRFTVTTPNTLAVIGRDAGHDAADGISIDADPAWRTVTFTRIDGRSPTPTGAKRGVLVTTGDYANTGWRWSDDHKRMLTDWGREPTLVETVPVTLRLRASSARLWALDPTGRRIEEVKPAASDGTLVFRVGPPYTRTPTLWYEVEWQ